MIKMNRLVYDIEEYDYDLGYINITKSIEITSIESEQIKELTPEILYQHIKVEGVNKVTPTGKTILVPTYNIGNLKMSIQFSYYLWSYRAEMGTSLEISNTPCTEEEFKHICPSINTLLDVQVTYGKEMVMKATQMTLNELVGTLQDMV